jgi:enoyl-[acyl-carrier-protein] reductase (NADH)
MSKEDRDLKAPQILSLSNRDEIVGFFTSLDYDTSNRIVQTPGALGISSTALESQIKFIERIASQE